MRKTNLSCALESSAFVIGKFVEHIPLGQFLGPIKTLSALTAAIGAIGQKEENPEFQEASAFGAMHVIAAT